MQSETPDPKRTSFDTAHIAARRDRGMDLGFRRGADFLHREVAGLVAERLAEVTRDFADAAIIGSGSGTLAAALAGRIAQGGLRQIELSPARAALAEAENVATLDPLPLTPGSLDLAVSALELHWQNDPVGHLIQLRRALRPDGLMIAALFGGQTLHELRTSLAEAEVETTGGLSPRIAPMGEVRDLGGLLQRAGYAMPVADVERLSVTYESPLHLMRDLRAMGETNILSGRRHAFLRRDTLARACEIYQANFPAEGRRVRATFEIVFLTGWAPSESQPKPLRPGTAAARLADALGVPEQSAGEKTAPGWDNRRR